jgi:hypothetical protein
MDEGRQLPLSTAAVQTGVCNDVMNAVHAIFLLYVDLVLAK